MADARGRLLRSGSLKYLPALLAFDSQDDCVKVSVKEWSGTFRTDKYKGDRTPKAKDKDFKPFDKLALETKAQIIYFALEGRTIQGIECSNFVVPNRELPIDHPLYGQQLVLIGEDFEELDRFKIVGAAMPTPFNVCREFRSLARWMDYRPMFQIKGSSKKVMFDPDLDTFSLSLCSQGIPIEFYNPTRFPTYLVQPLDFTNIQKLSLDLTHASPSSGALIELVSVAGPQTKLTINRAFSVAWDAPGFTFKIDLDWDKELDCGTPSGIGHYGYRVTGDNDVGASLMYWLPDWSYVQDCAGMLTVIERAMKAAAQQKGRFPDNVKFVFQFIPRPAPVSAPEGAETPAEGN